MHEVAGKKCYLKGNGNGFDKTIQEAQVGVGRVVRAITCLWHSVRAFFASSASSVAPLACRRVRVWEC